MLGTKIEIACQKASAKHLRSIWHTDPKRIQVESITQGARSSLSSYTYIELSTKSWLLGHSELTAQTRILWSGRTQSMRREQLRGIKQTSLYCVISDWFFARGREWESEKGKDRRFHVNLDLWPQNEYRKTKRMEKRMQLACKQLFSIITFSLEVCNSLYSFPILSAWNSPKLTLLPKHFAGNYVVHVWSWIMNIFGSLFENWPCPTF
jgi:hypothetical protein